MRLAADLSHAQKQLYDQQSNQRQLAQKKLETLGTQLTNKNEQAQTLKGQFGVTTEKADGLSNQVSLGGVAR